MKMMANKSILLFEEKQINMYIKDFDMKEKIENKLRGDNDISRRGTTKITIQRSQSNICHSIGPWL